MSRKSGILLALAGLVIAGAIIAVLSMRSEGPPLTGWVQAFEPAEPGRGRTTDGAFFGVDGKPVALTDFRGKIVVLNLWATWCAPCIREMPSLIRLQKALAGQDVAVLAISQDRGGWDKITPFLKKHDFRGLAIYHDRLKLAFRALRIKGLPTTILFGRDGMELGRLNGVAEWDSPEAVALVRYYLGT